MAPPSPAKLPTSAATTISPPKLGLVVNDGKYANFLLTALALAQLLMGCSPKLFAGRQRGATTNIRLISKVVLHILENEKRSRVSPVTADRNAF